MIFTNDNNKKWYKVRDNCRYTRKYRRAAHDICNLRYKTPKEILAVFHNGSTYDYHFIIKELAEEFEGQFECLGENTENFITFSIKKLRKVKQSHTKWGLLTPLDLFDIHYNVLLIISGLHNYECINCKSCLNYVSTNYIQLIFKCMNIAKTIKSTYDKDLI